MADDKSVGTSPIGDYERRKFYNTGEVSYVRVIPIEEPATTVTDQQLIVNTLQKILKQAELTNLYLVQIVGDNLGDGCG